MSTPRLLLPVLLLLGLAVPLTAAAQKGGGGGGGGTTTTSYIREFMNVCGGTAFVTCASVKLTVSSNNNVTMHLWNTSGGAFGGNLGAIISNISLLNVPTTAYTTTNNVTGGTYYQPSGQPNPFTISDTNADQGGQITLTKNAMLLNKVSARADSLANGLASACAAGNPGITGVRLWMTQSDGCSSSQIASSISGANYVQFSFTVNQAFDPNLHNVALGITSIDMTSPLVSSYYVAYATPEPATMALLGSGLLGLGGLGARRRRREREGREELA